MDFQGILVVDFGGQYNQLIARRVRETNVYCEIVSYRVGLDAIRAQNPKGIIFTGGPNSVYVDGAPTIDPAIFDLGIPVLGKIPMEEQTASLVDKGAVELVGDEYIKAAVDAVEKL